MTELSTMSEDVQNVQFTPLEQMRWAFWKQHKKRGLTDFDIAFKLGLTATKQIQRLKHKARENGEYQKWLDSFLDTATEEFWELHKIVKDKNPEVAYIQIGRIMERQFTQKTENINEQVGKIVVEVVDPNSSNSESTNQVQTT